MPRYINAEALRESWLYNGENERIYDTNDFLESLDDAPTADVEPVRHGRWEYGNCSVCSVPAVTMRQVDGVEIRVETPRCPNCGAKMDGESEVEDDA